MGTLGLYSFGFGLRVKLIEFSHPLRPQFGERPFQIEIGGYLSLPKACDLQHVRL
jgi:hypothetical protein